MLLLHFLRSRAHHVWDIASGNPFNPLFLWVYSVHLCYCCSCLLTSKYCFGYGIIPICFLEFHFLSVVYIVTKNEVLSATISMTLASITITLFVQVLMILAFHLGPLKVCYYSLNFILHVVYVHLAYLFLLVLWYSFLYADIIQLFFLGVCAYVYRFVLLVV